MKFRVGMAVLAIWFGLVSCVSTPVATPLGSSRPNIVLIVVDDLGWRDVGFMGSDFYQTPNVDRLAAQSLQFTRAYSSSPVCSPTRAALMTGNNPVRYHITDWIPGHEPNEATLLDDPEIANQLPLEATTLAEYLREAGYATHFSGKWHLGESEPFWPQHQGFDSNAGGWAKGGPNGSINGRRYFAPHANPMLADGPDGEFLTERLGEESLAFLDRQSAGAQPFLLVHAFYQVHTPIEPAPAHIASFKAKADALPADPTMPQQLRYGEQAKSRQDNPAYASMVAAMDREVGRIMEKLEASGLADDTVIIFTSDNGGLSHLRGSNVPTSNAPLRGTKGWLYEGGIRVPLLIRAPGVTAAGSRSDQLAISEDLLPTLLALAHVPPAEPLDGVNLLGPQSGNTRALYWHFPHYHATQWRPGGAIRDGNYKLIEYFEDGAVELFDLAQDPGEERNLAAANPERARQLRARLQQWRKDTGARMPLLTR